MSNPTPTSSWSPIGLVALGDSPPPEASIGGISYPGSLVLFFGEPESVKTWANLVLCLEEIRKGETTLWVDFEMTPRTILGRLRDLGATDEEVARFLYVQPSEPIGDPHVHATVSQILETHSPTLCVVDAMAGAFALHGFDGNVAADVERFYGSLVALLRSGGAAVHIIDHVVKDRENRGRWPIGSQRKLGGCDVGLSVEMIQGKPFGRGLSGVAKLKVAKDRHGALARPYAAELTLSSDGDTGLVTWAITMSQDNGEAWRPTIYMDKVLDYLSRQGEPVMRSDIPAGVGGKRDVILKAINYLLADDKLVEIPGAGRGKLLTLAPKVPTFPDVPGT